MSLVLEVQDLVKRYAVRTGWLSRAWLSAVDGVSLTVAVGETLALVGESGSGKSTVARCILRLEPPSGGRIRVNGRDVTELGYAALRPLRRHMQMVFQDPAGSLNPQHRVGAAVAEPLWLFGLEPIGRARRRAAELLGQVGLAPEQAHRFPSQLSGGQQQRVSVARAIVAGPGLVVLDEPTSALDVSVQAHLLDLLRDLQQRLGLGYLFISHDLSVVATLATRVAVMYRGRIVETGPTRQVFREPRHPYTQALIAAVPAMHPRMRRRPAGLWGEVPAAGSRLVGCRLVGRCPAEMATCRAQEPALVEVASGHRVACHLYPPAPGPETSHVAS
jgi:oligopeptide/dipeptide ABC transporter ATP-binding protein